MYPARRGGGRRRQAGELQLTHIVFCSAASQERRNALLERSARHASSPPGAGAQCAARQRATDVTITAHQFSDSCARRARRCSRRHSLGRTTARHRRQGACAPCHHRGVGGTAGTFCQSCWCRAQEAQRGAASRWAHAAGPQPQAEVAAPRAAAAAEQVQPAAAEQVRRSVHFMTSK